jgi:hypothetical protein
MLPLELNDEEMSVLLSLSAPIDQQQRPQFLLDVAQELEAQRQVGAVGIGSVHRTARVVQRRYFTPPESTAAGTPVHRGVRA